MSDRVMIRVRSHRALERLKRITTDVVWYFNLREGNDFASIPAEHLEAAREIPGITRARPKHELYRCWG